MRRAMTAPGDREALRAPTAVLRALASKNPRSFPVQMALGTALRKEHALDEAMQAFERAALVPVAGGKDSTHDQMAAIVPEEKDNEGPIAELTAAVAVDVNNVDAARRLAA